MAGSGSASRPQQVRRGSSFTDKQIWFAVAHDRPVEVTFPDGSTLEGWVCGMDDFHWGVCHGSGQVTLVHKSVPKVSILDGEMYGPVPDLIEQVVAPFRDSVMREHFGQTSRQPQPA